jgi:CubicO group peptidase (beta-lactamase class C family)
VPDHTVDRDAVERLIEAHRAADLEPGLAWGVVRDGELLLGGGRGAARLDVGAPDAPGTAPDVDTVFRIASMTKSFTASTVLLLRDDGRLRLDDEVARYVPEVAALRPPTDDAPPLTVRNLLTMTAGFPTDDPWGDRQQDLPDDDFARLVAGGLAFAWAPGTVFEYSNLGYALLGRVVTAATGEPYPDVVTGRLLDPLGMTSTVWTDGAAPDGRLAQGYRRSGPRWEAVPFAGYGAFAPMGGLFSTVRDLARWVGGLSGAFPPRDTGTAGDAHPLRRSSRRELQLPQLGLPPLVAWPSLAEPPVVRGLAYGFGLVVERDPRLGAIVSHSGGYPGFGSHMRWHPSTGLGVVVLGNATYTPAARLGAQIMDSLLADSHRGRGPDRGPVPAPGTLDAEGAPGSQTAAATEQARRDVTRLVTAWDDDLAERLFAMNVDLDEPLTNRRAAVERIVATIGPLERDEAAPVTSSSPAHRAWWLRGPGGRVRVEIRMSPELPPRVQTLTVTAVPEPSAALRRAADAVARLLGTDGEDLADETLSPGGELAVADDLRQEAARQLRVAAAWAGASRITEVVAGDGRREATFRLEGERCAVLLAVTVDPATGTVTALTLSAA